MSPQLLGAFRLCNYLLPQFSDTDALPVHSLTQVYVGGPFSLVKHRVPGSWGPPGRVAVKAVPWLLKRFPLGDHFGAILGSIWGPEGKNTEEKPIFLTLFNIFEI